MASFQSKGLMKGSGTSFSSDEKAILGVFIGAIIAVTFMLTIGDSIFEQTNVLTVINATHTPGTVNTSTDIQGREVVSVIEIYNQSMALDGDDIISGGNVTITTGMSATTGLLSVQLNMRSNSSEIIDTGQTLNVTYTYLDDGYVSTSSGRAVTVLIMLFAALAIVVFVIVMFIKKGSLGELMKWK